MGVGGGNYSDKGVGEKCLDCAEEKRIFSPNQPLGRFGLVPPHPIFYFLFFFFNENKYLIRCFPYAGLLEVTSQRGP